MYRQPALSQVQTCSSNSTATRRHGLPGSRIAAAELPVRHQTSRKGRPYTLVLTKSETLFDLERQARIRDKADMEWLATESHSQ